MIEGRTVDSTGQSKGQGSMQDRPVNRTGHLK